VAKVNITPEKPMWMSGYAGRDHAAEGTETDLWARALAIEDAQGQRAVLITLDLVGIDRITAANVCRQLQDRYQLVREQVAINCSHTHCGPVAGRTLRTMFFFDSAQQELVDEYTAKLEWQLIYLVGDALKQLAPATLSYGQGTCDVAVNRRNNKEAEVEPTRAAGQLKGPVDHRVPVLAVKNADGKLLAVTFGYACHATVLSFYRWCGDYPGYAVAAVEEHHPGAVAMFWAGCGADQNPLPRRTVELARNYGGRLAASVSEVLNQPMTALAPSLDAEYQEIALPLDTLPTRAELESQSQDQNKYVAARANALLRQVDSGKPLSPTYPYPVQVWRLGPELRWVFLGGEVVVDYSLRIAKELGSRPVWVAGYSNDVMAYIPSLRVLNEGGYEGKTAMIYYGLPTHWAPTVEEQIVAEVVKLSQQAQP
jgi:hypothetical protein